MTLFSRLFRKAPPPPAAPPTTEESIATLESGSDDLILETALGDGDEAVRTAAILKLPDGEALRRLAGLLRGPHDVPGAASGALERAAQTRVARSIDDGSIDFAKFCDQAPNRTAMLSVAALCKDPTRLPRAFAVLGDPAQVAQLVVSSTSSRVRQLAAESIEDPAQLRLLLKQVRGKDKNVFKILKHKLDALNAAERSAAQIVEEINALCASLERHSHRGYDALYTSTFEHLCGRWRAISAQRDVDVERRACQAIDRCEEVIAEHLRRVELQAAEKTERQAADEARRRAAQEAAAAEAAAAEERRREAEAIRAAEEAALAEKLAAQDLLFRQIGGLIRKAHEALGEGTTQKAAGLRRAIEEKRAGSPELPVHLTRNLAQLDAKLDELKQWKDYAVAPKRVALIEAMEGLIGSTEDPKKLAERIKTLQQEWRTIGKGIVSEASEDWERFHRAAQAAYQPCSDYFAAQAKLRQQNLESRKAVLERLAAFESAQNTENPDWRFIARVLREAPQEWRRYFPVDREPGRAVQQEFDALIGRIKAKLDAWHERNVADKQVLITRARHVLTMEDSREAIDAVKRLQGLWKETGPAQRDQEHSLWSEFREVCDAVYQKRHQVFAEYTAGLEANKARAIALCEEIERAAQLFGPALLEGSARMPEWRGSFESLWEMPRADARVLQDRFERAIERCQARLDEQRQADQEQSFANLFEAGRHVQTFGWAVVQNLEAGECERLKQAADTFIASVRQWPKGGLQCIKDALAQAGSRSGARVAERETALRVLCIRGEILSERPTPPEDEALRREYQVQRLMQGMGQGVREDDWDALTLAWLRSGAIAPDIYEQLERRFLQARSHQKVRSAEQSYFHPDAGDRKARRPDRDRQRARNR